MFSLWKPCSLTESEPTESNLFGFPDLVHFYRATLLRIPFGRPTPSPVAHPYRLTWEPKQTIVEDTFWGYTTAGSRWLQLGTMRMPEKRANARVQPLQSQMSDPESSSALSRTAETPQTRNPRTPQEMKLRFGEPLKGAVAQFGPRQLENRTPVRANNP